MNVVFIGDSNHAVSPFAGNGANMAMADAWDLAEQLCKHETLEDALKAYDSIAIPRSKAVIKFSHRTIVLGHATGWRLWLYSF
jgi:2-polyprenyl-6-methoxyphenol hydroxylase-like FAD-dependent oxidoreductase